MEARVLVLIGQPARDVDFSGPVDLTVLSYQEFVRPEDEDELAELVPVVDATEIDYVIVHTEQASGFDGAFDDLRPRGIPERGLHLDILLQGVPDQTSFNIAAPDPVVRLTHVSRTIAEQPYMPFLGRRLAWNSDDRRENLNRVRRYFCSDASRDPHFCGNAFR